ncbi:hypothetical protein [Chachezhania antarctica]|uniref:hypothetical protein n=1 Tax=Chachezhania antarctica TaxID=2340860 RepID=UPI00196917B7|nr:hypothetical protein [Chachezhania antarctica]
MAALPIKALCIRSNYRIFISSKRKRAIKPGGTGRRTQKGSHCKRPEQVTVKDRKKTAAGGLTARRNI